LVGILVLKMIGLTDGIREWDEKMGLEDGIQWRMFPNAALALSFAHFCCPFAF
jgi:hypothetical protein